MSLALHERHPSASSGSINPVIPTTRPKTEIRLPPSLISAYQSLLSLPPRSPLIALQIEDFPHKLLKKPPFKLPPFLQWISPHPRKRAPYQCCELCDLHSPLLEAPLVHLMGLLGYEMYTHLQNLRAMHPAQRSEFTNELLAHLHPWYENRYLMPGTTVKGCLACALGRLYNDTGAMNAIAVTAKSGRKRGRGGEIIYPILIEEGWLGLWAETSKGVSEVRKDRTEARKLTGINTKKWTDGDKGVDFKPMVWDSKTSPRDTGHEREEEARLIGPMRPDRPKGLTLGVSMLGEQKKKRSTAPPAHDPGVAKPAESRLREQVRMQSPVSPKTKGPEMMLATSARVGQKPLIQRSHTADPRPTQRREEMDVSVPAPLRVGSRKHNNRKNPFADPKRPRSNVRTAKAPANPFFGREERRWNLSFFSSSDVVDDDGDDDEGVVGHSIIRDAYSDSDYSGDETEQRYLDEHDELLKLAGGKGWGGRLQTRDYLNTLPGVEGRL